MPAYVQTSLTVQVHKQSEDQRPQDGALPKPPRSRFRADGRRRRTSGELKKRAPSVQYWKDIQAKQRGREEERASSHRDRPRHFRIHTDESQEAEEETEAESPQTAPTEDLCATRIQRLHRVVELLEQLAQAGLPTLLSTYYRSATSLSITTRSMATPLQPSSQGWGTGTCH